MSGNRAKLVKARPKAVEHLPDWGRCCQPFIDSLSPEEFGEEITVIGYRQREAESAYCSGCGNRKPAGINVLDSDNCLTPVEFLDLDETGVANGNYVEGPVNL